MSRHAGTATGGATVAAVEARELPLPPVSAETRRRIETVRDRYPQPKSAILPALWAIQDEYGWLPPQGMEVVAELLGLRPSEVQAVSTFYSMYFQRPAGRHHIMVCVNTSCALRGADDVCAYLERTLGVPSKGTTADGEFTWEATIECLGACGYAPMMQVDHIFHENLTPERIDAVLEKARGTAHGAHPRRGTHTAQTQAPPSEAAPTKAEVGAPPAQVPAPSVHHEAASDQAGLLAEGEIARTPGAPKVEGPMASFTEQPAPGAEESPDAAPKDAAEAFDQRGADPRRRRGRRDTP